MVFVTRRETFSSAHRLFNQQLSANENLELFGKCSNERWHGHNYVLHVTVKGELNPQTGMVINLKTLSAIIKDHVISQLDHKNLNEEVSFLQGKITTSENIAIGIWNVLQPLVNKEGAQMHCVKLAETENSYVEYFG